jgi:hypothetical protein
MSREVGVMNSIVLLFEKSSLYKVLPVHLQNLLRNTIAARTCYKLTVALAIE